MLDNIKFLSKIKELDKQQKGLSEKISKSVKIMMEMDMSFEAIFESMKKTDNISKESLLLIMETTNKLFAHAEAMDKVAENIYAYKKVMDAMALHISNACEEKQLTITEALTYFERWKSSRETNDVK